MSEPWERDAARLDRLRLPVELAFRHDGGALAVTVTPPLKERGESFQSRIWLVPTKGEPVVLTHGPGGDALPRFAPKDGRLAFASDRQQPGRMALYLLDSDAKEPRRLGSLPGTAEEILWAPDGTALVVSSADRGLETPPTEGAVPMWWGDERDPKVDRPGEARRRLIRVDAADGSAEEVGPADLTVWAYDLIDANRAVAIVSADPTERGWYRAHLALLDLAARSARTLHRTEWMLQSPAADPTGRRVAFCEGWASDRLLVAGEIRVIDLDTGKVTSVAADRLSDVTWVQWRDGESLWFAGWQGHGTMYGVVRLDGAIEWIEQEEKAVLGPNSFFAHVAPGPDGKSFAAVRQAVGVAPEVVYRADESAPWSTLTRLNDGIAEEMEAYPEVHTVEWPGAGGLTIRGLLLLPQNARRKPGPLVVDIHGGPTWAYKHSFDHGYALALAGAGYPVFLPNYRGSAGRGQSYSRRNLRDPGGAEFVDILNGVDWCVQQGLADARRVGVTGVSYGGYMTAWAVATASERFAAAVMVSGIANLLSCNYTCNHDFCAAILRGPFTDPQTQRLFIERSPLTHIHKAKTPTLILHGAEDHCTPLGQAEEFYRGLADHGVESELVVYPREGHGWRERIHHHDAFRRTVAWFDRHLRA